MERSCFKSCFCSKEGSDVNKIVMLSLTQHLRRLLLSFINGMRGRSQIKFGMTPNFNDEALNKGSFRAPLCFGFTLIELLVVVLIIGILAAVAVPQYQKAVDRAKYKQAVLAARKIAEAEQLYYLANGTLATDLSQLDLTFGAEYGNYGATGDKITFDWGKCNLTSWLNMPTCILKSPYVWYMLDALPNVTRQTCVADVASKRALAVCQAELPQATCYDSDTYCSNRTCRICTAPWP